MSDLQKLSDVEEIKRTKARYCRFVDLREWAQLRKLFTDDCRFVIAGNDQSVEEFISLARRWLGNSTSVHSVSMPGIEVANADKAAGIWGMEDIVSFPAEGDEPPKGIHGWGHYHEEYRKEGTHWLIHRLTLTRLRLEIPPGRLPRCLTNRDGGLPEVSCV
ncbi:nuclear transport factor 2 family protein [Streptomyces sp. NPDC006475]|uniref:nuclear transport factor 2 family protein n=1 Tax=Streptomyces sp. NPDC006475 TaxID=3155719 RepID=UPI0033A9FECF